MKIHILARHTQKLTLSTKTHIKPKTHKNHGPTQSSRIITTHKTNKIIPTSIVILKCNPYRFMSEMGLF